MPIDGVFHEQASVRVTALETTIAELEQHLNEARTQLALRDHRIGDLQQQIFALDEEVLTLQHQVAAQPTRPVASVARVGRNDPCPCGSGLKYKLCHSKSPVGE